MANGRGGVAMLCHLWAAAMILRSAVGMFVVEKSSIRVMRPVHIRGRHESAIANFGIPNYGGTLSGVVLYPGKGSTGCSPFDGAHFKSRSGRPVILLLDRGGLCEALLPTSLASVFMKFHVVDECFWEISDRTGSGKNISDCSSSFWLCLD